MPRPHGWCLLTRTTYQGQPVVLVEWTPDPEASEALKRQVPRASRVWEPLQHVWRVQAAYEPALIALAKTFAVAELHDGNQIVELHSGRLREQLELF
jgi:hypothetical protein